MSGTRRIQKVLGAQEDLLFGFEKVKQMRNGKEVEVTPLPPVRDSDFNVEALINLLDVEFIDGEFYSNGGFYPDTVVGGGRWKAVASEPHANFTGGTVVTIGALQAWKDAAIAAGGLTKQNLIDTVNVFLEWTGTGTGAFVRAGSYIDTFAFGAVDDLSVDNTAAFTKQKDSIGSGECKLPAGKFRVNLVYDTNNRIRGKGHRNTVFYAQDPAKPIIKFSSRDTGISNDAKNARFFDASGFDISGEGTASVGLQFGDEGSRIYVAYSSCKDIFIDECVDNIVIDQVVGLKADNIYSQRALSNGLFVDVNDILTVATFTNCAFRLCDRGLSLEGGAIINFRSCVSEYNKSLGVYLRKTTPSGLRQAHFSSFWCEGNGLNSSFPFPGDVYIDMGVSLDSGDNNSNLTFKNSLFSSNDPDGLVPIHNVYLQRGENISFNTCAFRGLDSQFLQFNAGNNNVYATLINCGVADLPPSPSVYTNFPERVTDASGGYSGFSYEYMYKGEYYTNISGAFTEVASGTTDNIDVSDRDLLIIGTATAPETINSFSGGKNSQVITVIKKDTANSLTLSHNGTGDQPIYNPDGLPYVINKRSAVQMVCYDNIWYLCER